MIAMALAGKPALLIADEPTTSLDVTTQKEILDLLLHLQVKQGMSMLFITHDFGVLTKIADRALVMKNGSIVEENSIANLLQNPTDAYSKALINCRIPLQKRFTKLPTLQQSSAGQIITEQDRAAALQNLYAQAPIINVTNLSATYARRKTLFSFESEKVKALKDISIDIYPGETFGIVGESGSGKSTFGRCLVGLVNSFSGSICYNGNALQNLSSTQLQHWRKDIQYVYQDPYAALNPNMRIGDAIMEPLEAHHIYKSYKERKEQALELLTKVGLLETHFERLPHEFSGGERQRICIARALALNPKILICDESVSALDVSIQAQIINLLTT
jgi:peptide/nickel transport system ATP-binding protein